MQRSYLNFAASLLVSLFCAQVRADTPQGNPTVQQKLRQLEGRLEDFYKRLDDEDRADEARARAESEMREYRKNQIAAYDKAREEYVKNRKLRTEPDPSLWQAEIKARQDQHRKDREEYVKQRDQYRREAAKIGRIPGDVEFGINQSD